jgi:protein-S-isoprenylcysteine O-methyltransferase Ste14
MSLAYLMATYAPSLASAQLVQDCLLGWAGLELLLWLRNRGGNTAPDPTFALVVASVAAGMNLAFRAAHDHATAIGGGPVVTAAGLTALVLGEARLSRDLGDDYRRYALHTKRLIPGLW